MRKSGFEEVEVREEMQSGGGRVRGDGRRRRRRKDDKG